MAVQYNASPMVTDGLVLALDAGNAKSYPGSGTTWNDLSGNGNNGTLVNGVGYDSGNGGALSFDGVNDYVQLSSPLFTSFSSISISSFIKFNTTSESCQIFDMRDGSGDGPSLLMSNPEGNVLYSSMNSSNISGNNTIVSGLVYYVTLTYDGSVAKIYLNGSIDNTKNISETFNISVNPTIATRSFSIGSANKSNCNIYNMTVYNRALTASEIQQNFNALRGRFGI